MNQTFKEFFLEQQQQKQYKETVAVVPGAFKPPHAGHYAMVKEYADMADKVVVIISNPSKDSSVRKTPSGKPITSEISKEVWDLYTKSLGNVEVVISDQPSPVKAAYDYIETLKDVNVILGASKKGGDWKRWSAASKYFKDFPVNVLDPEKTAVNPSNNNMSATDFRNALQDNKEKAISFLPKHLSKKEIESVFEILK